jgi:hypothetical protein
MRNTGRRIVAAVFFAVNLLAAIVGIWLGVPQLIAQNAQRLPQMIVDPTTLWVAFLLFVGVIGVALILVPWGRDSSKKEPPESLGAPFIIEDALMRLIDGALTSIEATDDVALKLERATHWTDHQIPTFLERALGKREKDKYVEAIAASRATNDAPIALLRVAYTYLKALVTKRLNDKFDEMLKSIPHTPQAGA